MSYVTLRDIDFRPGQPLPGLVPAGPMPGVGVPYHHSTISAHKILERISSGVGCPTILQQGSGTTLCTIVYTYSNARVAVPIVKS